MSRIKDDIDGGKALYLYINYGIRGNARDNSESSERALDDLQGFPSFPKSLYDSLCVVLTHMKLFLAT